MVTESVFRTKTLIDFNSSKKLELWKFYYGPTGIDKVTRNQGGIQNLTIDYSTDTNGRILSMTYTEAGGYSGELFAVYDNFGNISAWIDPNGYTKYAAIYDLNNGLRNELHNPLPGINVPYGFNARNGDITIQVGTDRDLIINSEGNDFSITNPWGDIDVTDLTTSTTTDDTTDKDGGDGAKPCVTCPGNQVLVCDCYYAAGTIVQTVVGGDCPTTVKVEKEIAGTSITLVLELPLESKKCRCVDAIAV